MLGRLIVVIVAVRVFHIVRAGIVFQVLLTMLNKRSVEQLLLIEIIIKKLLYEDAFGYAMPQRSHVPQYLSIDILDALDFEVSQRRDGTNRSVLGARRAFKTKLCIELVKEGMVPNTIHGYPPFRLGHENSADEILRLHAKLRRHPVMRFGNIAKEQADVAFLRVVERCGTCEHDIQDHATAPDISLCAIVWLATNDFRRSIMRTSARRAEKSTLRL
jgi:hypothetical protein